MSNWQKRIVGIILVAYIVWMAYNVIYGIAVQVMWFCSDDFLLELFQMTMYMYIGSWITFIAFILSSIFCLRASLSYTRGAANLILSGILGMMGYIVGFVTSSINKQIVQAPTPYIFAPVFVFLVGLLSRNKSDVNVIYIPLFFRG